MADRRRDEDGGDAEARAGADDGPRADRDVLDALYGDDADDDVEGGAGEWSSLRSMLSAAKAGDFDEEPPPRIDALLMAAARQHAPKPRVPWWGRIAAWMRPMVAHPALAGAAALVIVGGAAGVMYQRGKVQMAYPRMEVAAPAPAPVVPAEPPPAPELPVEKTPPVADPAGAVAVTLDDAVGAKARESAPETKPQTPGGPRKPSVTHRATSDEGQKRAQTAALDLDDDAAGGDGLLAGELRKAEMLEAREEDEEVTAPVQIASGLGDPSPRAGSAGGTAFGSTGAGGAARSDGARVTNTVPPPPPPPPPTEDVVISEQARDSKVSGDRATTAAADRTRGPDNRAQAVQLFGQARIAARGKNCAATRVMSERVKKLDAVYHRDVFVRDPDIAKCL